MEHRTMTSTRGTFRTHPITSTLGVLLIALFAVLAGSHTRASADPVYQPNDNWANASTLPGAGTFDTLIKVPTKEAGEPAAAGDNTIWFKWKAPVTGPAKFNTHGSHCATSDPVTTKITSWTGSMGNLAPVGNGTFDATGGVTYSIAVNAKCVANLSGVIQLNWNPQPYAETWQSKKITGDAGTVNASNRGAGPAWFRNSFVA